MSIKDDDVTNNESNDDKDPTSDDKEEFDIEGMVSEGPIDMSELELVKGQEDEISLDDMESKFAEMEVKAKNNWDKALRAMSDLENFRRRAERDVANAHKFALEKFIDDLIPVIDSLEHALSVEDNDNSSHLAMREGIELTLKMFLDALLKYNVVQLNPLGEIFDPKYHEAMSTQVDENAEDGTVLVVFQKGYKLNDRVIRAAMVIVAKNETK